MAESITFSATSATEEITFAATIDSEEVVFQYTDAARGPAGDGSGGGGVDSYVNDIESLDDYPSAFPTTVPNILSVATNKLIGRHTSGSGTAQEIGIDGGLELHGGNLRRAAVTGPVTIAAGGSTSTIADGALTIAMTSGLQTILDGSTGGNGAADAGKLAKFYSNGSLYAYEFNTGTPLTGQGSFLGNEEIGVWSGTGYSFIISLAEEDDSLIVLLPRKSGTVAFMDDVNIKLTTDPTGITGAAALTNIVSLTQAQYDAIGSKSSTTLYIIT